MALLTSTFEVSNVPSATKTLPEVSYSQAVDCSVGRRKERVLNPVDGGNAEPEVSIDACSGRHRRLVAFPGHSIIGALFHAFNDHRPLCLSPDMIWLLLCQGVASHVNVHAESLRSRFVQHEGKLRIEVRRDGFVSGSSENPWGDVIDEFSAKVREEIGPASGLFVPRFSTTGVTERIAAEVVLLDAVQNYFEFVVRTICGIPTISLEGTVEDWQELADRAEAFAEYDLEWWMTALRPILQEFIAAARGHVRGPFWQSIYRFGGYSGGAAVTGWITAFFPYLKDEQGNAIRKNSWLVAGGPKLKRLLAGEWHGSHPGMGDLSPSDFPSGLSRAPFKWLYLTQTFHMEFLGGFVGMAQDPTTLTLRPEIGWAIRRVPA
jgi:Domain of unknown function (DUF4419)